MNVWLIEQIWEKFLRSEISFNLRQSCSQFLQFLYFLQFCNPFVKNLPRGPEYSGKALRIIHIHIDTLPIIIRIIAILLENRFINERSIGNQPYTGCGCDPLVCHQHFCIYPGQFCTRNDLFLILTARRENTARQHGQNNYMQQSCLHPISELHRIHSGMSRGACS